MPMLATVRVYWPRATHTRWRAALAIGIGLVLAASATWAQEPGVSLRVFNTSFNPVEVRIVDAVCRAPIFEGEIQSQASVLLTGCRDTNGEAAITVEDHTGRVQTFNGLLDGGEVQLEFDEQ
jgi:hypothetical protein